MLKNALSKKRIDDGKKPDFHVAGHLFSRQEHLLGPSAVWPSQGVVLAPAAAAATVWDDKPDKQFSHSMGTFLVGEGTQ